MDDRLFAVLAACAAACSAPPAPTTTKPRTSPDAAEPPSRDLGLHLDIIVAHERYATVTEADLRHGARLDELIAAHPLGSWTSITIAGPGVGPIDVLHPITNYPLTVPRVLLLPAADRASFELVPIGGGEPVIHQDGIDEVRIELAPDEAVPIETLTAGCTPPRRTSELVHPAKRWRGEAYQFDTATHWFYDVTIDLGPGRRGARVGTLVAHGLRHDEAIECTADLLRAPDRGVQRVVQERVTSGRCVDGTFTFGCAETSLRVRGFTVAGDYVMSGLLAPDP